MKEQNKEVIEETAESIEQEAVVEETAESIEQGGIIEETAESTEQETVMDSEQEKGYDLPVSEQDREEAEQDSYRLMTLLAGIYQNAEKGDSSNVVLDGHTMKQMKMKIKEQGVPVISSEVYSNMKNYKEVETFLTNAESGNKGSVVIYEIHSDGGVGREKYIYDGGDMFLLASNMVWDNNNKPSMSFISYTRLKEWSYSDQGWFCYEMCVPEYPEVTEMVDGCCLIRIKPMSRKKRRLSKQCVQVLGYQGNNLLCSNWDEKHMEKLDYNGLYEYLYEMKYKKKYNNKKYPDGIPKDQFESLIMEYLPVTAEVIQKSAVFDKKKGTYLWQRLGCFNYVPDCFGTSTPEVTKIKKNSDGTITLTVDAVCEMMLCDAAVITHELTVRFAEDGSFQYLGNKILNGGIKDIPEYQYRFVDK
ncbi:MAG: hypothetical protein K2J67_10460 [Lachnospiraceae bacterium]|nr:hypothetical protein [Lachnospiraceae bacterium]